MMKRADFIAVIFVCLFGLLLVTIFAVAARAQQCPPKQYECWQVRAAAAQFGEDALLAWARACGWTEEEISAARKCLK